MQLAREQWIPAIEENARRRNVALTNEPCVDMVSLSTSWTTRADGTKVTLYTIQPAIDDYYNFLSSGANLDRELDLNGQKTTLRKQWNVPMIRPYDVANLPCQAKVGVGTAVITSDGFLLLGIRGNTAIAGQFKEEETRKAVHVVAEGMIPEDVDLRGRISPERSARRGLDEELCISGGST